MEQQARLRAIKLKRKFNSSDIELQIDQMRTIQILLNLISNAIKFSPENGEIEIESNCVSAESDMIKVNISVIDHGIGISLED